MKFTKMEGCGNDYLYINCISEGFPKDPSYLSKILSDRHYGVGSDGIILIQESQAADFRMEIYNADGSIAKMCGNGLRCVSKYIYTHHLSNKTHLEIETQSGIRVVDLILEDDTVISVRCDMGIPQWVNDETSLPLSKDTLPHATEEDGLFIDLGNPHVVYFMSEVLTTQVDSIGSSVNDCMEGGINVEFVEILQEGELFVRIFERGSRETMACGTGACAAAVAYQLSKGVQESVRVHLLGGTLTISWSPTNGHLLMSGPAKEICTGDFDEDEVMSWKETKIVPHVM